jgi:hypothetical protein
MSEQRETTADDAAITRAAAYPAPLAGVSNRALARVVAGGGPAAARLVALSGRATRLQRAPVRPTGPARGTGPASAIAALNAKLKRPVSADAARKLIDQWCDAAVKAVGGATVASTGASHAGEIAATDVAELETARADQKQALVSFMAGRPATAGVKDWWDQFQRFVESKRRELTVEFRHNLAIDPAKVGDQDLGSYELALEGMPLDATWTSPKLITIKRGDYRGDIGGETDAAKGEIEMFDAGMTSAPYKAKCPALGGLHTDMQSIRHEIGHVVDERLTPKERSGLFDDILGWRVHLIQNITLAGNERLKRAKDNQTEIKDAGARLLDRQFLDLAQELGKLSTRAVLDYVGSFGDPGADDVTKPMPPIVTQERNGRVFWRRRYLLHSVGHPEELPRSKEFDYAMTAPAEYFPELYAYAINRPEFLAGAISKRQMKWWKEVVFKVPTDPGELKRQMQPPANVEAQFTADAEKLFTWEQLDARLAELTQAAAATPVAVPG